MSFLSDLIDYFMDPIDVIKTQKPQTSVEE